MRRLLSFCALLVSPLVSPLLAGNVVTNPSFAGSLAGWNVGISTYDGTIDATGVNGSGSAKNIWNSSGNSTIDAIDQCIPIGPGTYMVQGKVYIPSGQSVGGQRERMHAIQVRLGAWGD